MAALLWTPNETFIVNRKWCPVQTTSNLSGLHSIANLAELAFSPEPSKNTHGNGMKGIWDLI